MSAWVPGEDADGLVEFRALKYVRFGVWRHAGRADVRASMKTANVSGAPRYMAKNSEYLPQLPCQIAYLVN